MLNAVFLDHHSFGTSGIVLIKTAIAPFTEYGSIIESPEPNREEMDRYVNVGSALTSLSLCHRYIHRTAIMVVVKTSTSAPDTCDWKTQGVPGCL